MSGLSKKDTTCCLTSTEIERRLEFNEICFLAELNTCVFELSDRVESKLDKTAVFFCGLFGNPLTALAFALPKDCLLGKELFGDDEACGDNRVERECTFLFLILSFALCSSYFVFDAFKAVRSFLFSLYHSSSISLGPELLISRYSFCLCLCGFAMLF